MSRSAAIIIEFVLTAACFGWLAWMHHRQPVLERAAYLEGRYGLDHSTAMEFARKE